MINNKEIITSKDNPKYKRFYKAINNKKYRLEEKIFVVEGFHLVEEALKLNILIETVSARKIKEYPQSTILSKNLFNTLVDTINSEGIIGLCKMDIKSKYCDKILYLDNIQDPGNLGTIIRSAIAFDFTSIKLDNCVDIFSQKVLRSSQGGVLKVNLINDSINELKEKGYSIISTIMNGESIDSIDKYPDKLVVILGNEGNGIREELILKSDINLTIPMKNTESLNVGVAGSIIMHDINRKSGAN